VFSLKAAKGNSAQNGVTPLKRGKEAPTEADTMEIAKNVVLRELFEGPCKCCGESNHGVFEQITTASGKTRIALACTVVESEDWTQVMESGLRSMRFRADFGKLSENNDNDLSRVGKAMKNFTVHGEGRLMHYLELVDFDNDLHRYRKAMSGQNRFKREQRSDVNHEDLSGPSDHDQL